MGILVRMSTEKNALPGETGDDPSSDTPRELHTEADDERPLTRAEADVAGISRTPSVVYGDDSSNPNADDERDAHGA